MFPRKLIALLVIGFTLVLAALPVSANTGRVMHMDGDVQINGKPMSKIRMVKAGDQISTGANSTLMVVMSDKSVIDLQPNTKFKLEKFSFRREEPEQGSSIMSLLRGSFRYISGLVGRTNHANAKIRMGTTTAGIRGSFATLSFDGQTVSAEVSNGTMTMNFGDGTSMTINKGNTGTANQDGQNKKVQTTGKGNVVVTKANAILANPESAAAEMSSLTAAGKAMVLALMVAEYPNNPNLTSVVTAIVKSDPTSAPFVAAVIQAVSQTDTTATSLIQAVKDTEGVDDAIDQQVDDAAQEASQIDSSTDTGSTDTGTAGDSVTTSTGTTISGGGGVTSP